MVAVVDSSCTELADGAVVDMMLVENEVTGSEVCADIGVSDFWFMPVQAIVVSASSDTTPVLVMKSEVFNSVD